MWSLGGQVFTALGSDLLVVGNVEIETLESITVEEYSVSSESRRVASPAPWWRLTCLGRGSVHVCYYWKRT